MEGGCENAASFLNLIGIYGGSMAKIKFT